MSETKPPTDSEAPPLARPALGREVAACLSVLLLGVLATAAWRCLALAVTTTGASQLLVSGAYLLGVGASFALGALLARERWIALLLALAPWLPGLFWAPTLTHGAWTLLATVFSYSSVRKVQHELAERVQLSFRKSLALGLGGFMLALSCVTTSLYYHEAKMLSLDRLLPSFDLGQGSGTWLVRLMGMLSQPMNTLSREHITVDQFLGGFVPSDKTSAAPALPEHFLTALQQEGIDFAMLSGRTLEDTALTEWRGELGRFLGREVRGDEAVTSVIAEMLRHKLIAALSGAEASRALPVPILPAVFAFLVFFTVYPLAALARPLWGLLASALAHFLLRAKVLKLERVMREQERLL